MSNYIKTTDFAVKDTYASGDPRKVAKGADVDVEFNNIATAVATKQDSSGKGIANGYAPLDSGAFVPTANLPASVVQTGALNVFTVAQAISGSGTLLTLKDSSVSGASQLILSATSNTTRGAEIKLLGNGATTPSKTIRVLGGTLNIVNDAYTTTIFSVTDGGNVSFSGTATGNGSGLSSLNATNLTTGSITSSLVPLAAVSQWQASLKCRNVPNRVGTNVTIQAGGSPSGGSDGDLFYIY